ncbi:MAG: FKBP-type peptidyl-prolyl cis-trans isomerase [Cytophagales bacterium]|nr:MAG: FKBP-type peptidyl-prolyl cis-trans isomerase [Cytophagales bacterium]
MGTVEAQSKKTKTTTMTKTTTTIDSVSYALGVNIASNLKSQGMDNISTEMLSKAFTDVMKGNPLMVSNEKAESILNEFFMKLQAEKTEKNKVLGVKFLEENKKKPGVVTLPSGLQYSVMKEGDGEIPKETDKVTTHYHGTLIDGTVFDSSVDRGQPASFPVNGVIKGWVEALQLMKTGSKWKLFVPSELAYGERGAGGKIGPGATLVFEVELISIDK